MRHHPRGELGNDKATYMVVEQVPLRELLTSDRGIRIPNVGSRALEVEPAVTFVGITNTEVRRW